MHIMIKNEQTGQIEGVICVDRQTRNCTVLQHTAHTLESLVQIARAMKADHVYMLAPSDQMLELKASGWTPVTDPILMKRGD